MVATAAPLAVSKPASRRSSVDLPQPDGPTSDTNSPTATLRLSCSSACVPSLKRTETREKSNAGEAGGALGGSADSLVGSWLALSGGGSAGDIRR